MRRLYSSTSSSFFKVLNKSLYCEFIVMAKMQMCLLPEYIFRYSLPWKVIWSEMWKETTLWSSDCFFFYFAGALKGIRKFFERHSWNISSLCLPCSGSSSNVLFDSHRLWLHTILVQINFNCFFLNPNENSCWAKFINQLIRNLCINCVVWYASHVDYVEFY